MKCVSSMTISIYILRLEHGKFYVGASTDAVKASQEHVEGLGPFWTQIHRPLQLLDVAKGKKQEELDQYVKMTMRKHGIENVRGGSWEQARLSGADRHSLRAELGDSSCVLA